MQLKRSLPLLALLLSLCVNNITVEAAKVTRKTAPRPTKRSAPTRRVASYKDLGRGCAIIFTPDIAGKANRAFYEALGFYYIEDTSWQSALNRVIAYNARHKRAPISRIILEVHGNNGDGLKLQAGKASTANRSYISMAALQELLEGTGVDECIISACNSGRLFRPEIYKKLKKDKLLPANQGLINASKSFDPEESSVKILRRQESRYEAMTPLYPAEMPRALRKQMGKVNSRAEIQVSDLFLEYMLTDPSLQLVEQGYVKKLSKDDYTSDRSEVLIKRFLAMLNKMSAKPSPVSAKLKPPTKRKGR